MSDLPFFSAQGGSEWHILGWPRACRVPASGGAGRPYGITSRFGEQSRAPAAAAVPALADDLAYLDLRLYVREVRYVCHELRAVGAERLLELLD